MNQHAGLYPPLVQARQGAASVLSAGSLVELDEEALSRLAGRVVEGGGLAVPSRIAYPLKFTQEQVRQRTGKRSTGTGARAATQPFTSFLFR